MNATPHQLVLVLDMTTLRFQAQGGRRPVRVMTRDGQLLGVVYPRIGETQSDIAFRAMDAALTSGTVLDIDPDDPRRRVTRHIALLNPFTGDIAFRGTPDTVTFLDAGAVELALDGTPGEITGSDAAGFELRVDGHVLRSGVRGKAQLLSALELHAA